MTGAKCYPSCNASLDPGLWENVVEPALLQRVVRNCRFDLPFSSCGTVVPVVARALDRDDSSRSAERQKTGSLSVFSG